MTPFEELSSEKPFKLQVQRNAVEEIADYLAGNIINGTLPAGTQLSQVVIANNLGVSRTPVREALRALIQRGLVTAETNFRARVKAFDPDDLIQLFANRILNEAAACVATVSRLDDTLLDELERLLKYLSSRAAKRNIAIWGRANLDFHQALVSGASENALLHLQMNWERCDFYRHIFKTTLPEEKWWARIQTEHEEIVDAYRARDAKLAAECMASHSAQVALDLLAALAPEHDASEIAIALKIIRGQL